jgi:hypothetical protein
MKQKTHSAVSCGTSNAHGLVDASIFFDGVIIVRTDKEIAQAE